MRRRAFGSFKAWRENARREIEAAVWQLGPRKEEGRGRRRSTSIDIDRCTYVYPDQRVDWGQKKLKKGQKVE